MSIILGSPALLADSFNSGITDARVRTVLGYTPIQYLRMLERPGTLTALDSSGNSRNGLYSAANPNIMLAQNAGPYGGQVPQFSPANTSWIDAYSASFGAAANGAEGAAFIIVKADPTMWGDGIQHWFWIMRASATYYLALQKWSTNDQVRLRRFTVSTDISTGFSISTPLWFCIGMDWSDSAGETKLYINGIQQGATATITVPWSGPIVLNRIGRDAGSGTLYHSGGLTESIIFNAPLGDAGHLALAGEFANRNIFLGYGDSKTAANVYQHTTSGLLEGQGLQWDWRNSATSGYTVATSKAVVDAQLAAATYTPLYVLANLGANDVVAMPVEATWKSDYQYIFDAIKTKWPYIKIYVMRPWRRNYNAECDTLAGWISDLVTANPGVVFLGPDERIFIENGDDGATYSSDGIHPNTAGYKLTGIEWANVLMAA